jgi:hypothetical protein
MMVRKGYLLVNRPAGDVTHTMDTIRAMVSAMHWSRRATMPATLLVLIVAAHPYAAIADQSETPHRRATRMNVAGVVSKMESGLTTVRTPWGSMSMSTALTPKPLSVGEEIEMQVDDHNAMIDVHRRGTVIDLHRFSVEMTFDEHPHTKPGQVIQVSGQISKAQSGFFSVKTPVGQYTISKSTVPGGTGVGDEVSLWINNDNMVIDRHRKDEPKGATHRRIFGKLAYADKGKNAINLATPEGEQVIDLSGAGVKTTTIAEGSNIVVDLNEDGAVIALSKG